MEIRFTVPKSRSWEQPRECSSSPGDTEFNGDIDVFTGQNKCVDLRFGWESGIPMLLAMETHLQLVIDVGIYLWTCHFRYS